MIGLEEEKVPPCEICGKVWQRKDADKWYYFRDMVACRHHPGVEKWYQGALEMWGYKLELKLGREKFDDKKRIT